jgi:hypothetical protein
MLKWIDAWAETSRLNPWRLLRMPRPRLSEDDRRAFDAVLDGTPEGAEVTYELDRPRWLFLHRCTERGLLLHGTNELGLAELRTRATGDAFDAPVTALFASDDAIWPLYFATVNRATLQHGYINWAVHVRNEARYLFSIGADPRDERSWTTGAVYVLPPATFRRTRDTRELVSDEPVRPRAWLRVEPHDFPFRDATIGHRAGETPTRVTLRHARRLRR